MANDGRRLKALAADIACNRLGHRRGHARVHSGHGRRTGKARNLHQVQAMLLAQCAGKPRPNLTGRGQPGDQDNVRPGALDFYRDTFARYRHWLAWRSQCRAQRQAGADYCKQGSYAHGRHSFDLDGEKPATIRGMAAMGKLSFATRCAAPLKSGPGRRLRLRSARRGCPSHASLHSHTSSRLVGGPSP